MNRKENHIRLVRDLRKIHVTNQDMMFRWSGEDSINQYTT
jgi:hypothetical protein